MGSYLRLVSYVAALSLLLAGISLARPTWISDLGLDWWNLPALAADEEAAMQERSHFDTQTEIVKWRIAAKMRIIPLLLEKRLTLLEAAAWFGSLNHSVEGCPCLDPQSVGVSEEEALCRQVLRWTRKEVEQRKRTLAANAELAEQELQRLEEELSRLLCAGSPIVLPTLATLPELAE
jgi:hypothetical protein